MTPAQKELILLWLMMTARSAFSPDTPAVTAAQIVDGIASEYNATPPGGTWNWPSLNRTTAIAMAQKSINNTGSFGPIQTVLQNFVLTTTGSPWPGSGNHPRVNEIKVSLGMPN